MALYVLLAHATAALVRTERARYRSISTDRAEADATTLQSKLRGVLFTFEITNTFGDGICCRDGSGSLQITVNGEAVASNDGQFGDKVQETFEATTPNS